MDVQPTTFVRQETFVRQAMIAPLAPPRAIGGVFGWMHERLFAGVSNSILTIVSAVLAGPANSRCRSQAAAPLLAVGGGSGSAIARRR